MDSRNYANDSYPHHVDTMKEVFDLVDISLAERKNLFIWKARDKAFSYNMSSIAAYEMMMERKNTVVCMFPKGEEVKYKENFIAKYLNTINNLPQCMKMYPDLKDTQNELHYGYEDKDEETGQTIIRGANNRIAFLKVSRKDIAKSFRYKIGIIDEAGEIDCLKALIDTNDANTVHGGQRYGMQIVGGTSNAAHAGYNDVCLIWNNADKLGFNKFFIPRYKALWGWVPNFDDKYDKDGDVIKAGKETGLVPAIDPETGESKDDVAENYFKHREFVLKDIGDRNGLLEFKQNYPKTEDDAFLRVTSSPYNIEELSAQKRLIETNEEIRRAITRGNITLNPDTGKTEFKAAFNGRWEMFLPPNPDLILPDVIGVDTVATDDIVDSDSQNAMVVYRPFQSMKELSGLPVCIYRHRPASIYTFFNDALLTSMHYNAMTLIEYLNSMMFDYYIENGGGRFLAWRPTLLTELGSKAQNKWGVKAASGAATALQYAIEETKTNFTNQVFVSLITDLIDFGTKNTDLADAYKWAILQSKEMIKVKKIDAEKAKAKQKPKFQRTLVRVGNQLVVAKTQIELNSYKRRA